MKYDKCAERSCFYINITDDSTTVEEVEYFNFSLTLQNNGRHYAKLLNDSGAVFLLPKRMLALRVPFSTGNFLGRRVFLSFRAVCKVLRQYWDMIVGEQEIHFVCNFHFTALPGRKIICPLPSHI